MLDTRHSIDIMFSYVAFENKYLAEPKGSAYMNRIIFERYCHGKMCKDCILDMGEVCYISKLSSELKQCQSH